MIFKLELCLNLVRMAIDFVIVVAESVIVIQEEALQSRPLPDPSRSTVIPVHFSRLLWFSLSSFFLYLSVYIFFSLVLMENFFHTHFCKEREKCFPFLYVKFINLGHVPLFFFFLFSFCFFKNINVFFGSLNYSVRISLVPKLFWCSWILALNSMSL